MKISIAGAGAGKTTQMAEKIIDMYENTNIYQNIFCVSFTNNAVACIRGKLYKHFGTIPERIKVSTIHSFLYQEIIRPYYYLLYKKHYTKVVRIALPDDPRWRNKKICELENSNILHVACIPQRAKWVMSTRTNDKKKEKEIRRSILESFTFYCGAIYIDEAQDIDSDFFEILNSLELAGVEIEVIGDPKQDLRGFGNLRKLADLYADNVRYINQCHRCPQKHLNLSNLLVSDAEKQISAKEQGELTVVFEKDAAAKDIMKTGNFDLAFISQKNSRFETHSENLSICFDTLYHEIKVALLTKCSNISETKVSRYAYFYADSLISTYKNGSCPSEAMKAIFPSIIFDRQTYAKIIQALQINNNYDMDKAFLNSIDSIKGQEGENCFFVLTTDLAEYLLAMKTDQNKIKNRLYVALTRSLNKLTILVTLEVEQKYGRDVLLKKIRDAIDQH